MTGPNITSKTEAAKLRYQVSVPMFVHARIVRAAAAAKVSEGQYVEALFAGLVVPQIGKVHVTSDTPEVDAMRHLVGTLKIVPPGKVKEPPAGPVPVSDDALLRRGLKTRSRELYVRLCALSRGKAVAVNLHEMALEVGCNRANLGTYIEVLCAETLILYVPGTGSRSAKITAPYVDGAEREKCSKSTQKNPVHNGSTVPESELLALKLSPGCIWLYRCLCTLSDGIRLEIEPAKLCVEAGIKYPSLMTYLSMLKKRRVIYYSGGTAKKSAVVVAPVARGAGV